MTSMFLFSLILPQVELPLLLKLALFLAGFLVLDFRFFTLCGKRLLRFCADPNVLKLLLYVSLSALWVISGLFQLCFFAIFTQ